jgi:hypothetical protein
MYVIQHFQWVRSILSYRLLAPTIDRTKVAMHFYRSQACNCIRKSRRSSAGSINLIQCNKKKIAARKA